MAIRKETKRRLGSLPPTFTYTQARQHKLSDRALYRLRDLGLIEPFGRGLYRRTDVEEFLDEDLAEIAIRSPQATLCLVSALAHHGLTDEIPASIDVALPRGLHRPHVRPPVTWHAFNPDTFELGRNSLRLDHRIAMGIYDPMRCIIDAFRLARLEGPELGITALKRWLPRREGTPAQLLSRAKAFPGAERAINRTLAVLLAD